MTDDQQLDRHVVPVTVFVTVEAVDPRDAVNVAERAVRQELPYTEITVRTHAGYARHVTVNEVMDTATALCGGYLAVRPSGIKPAGR